MIGLDGATVRFGERTVLRTLTFQVPVGRALAILGPNGRGKTTALRAALGLQRLADGRRTAPAVVGYVPQSSAVLHPYRVRDVVAMGRAAALGLFGQPGTAEIAAADAALAQVGLTALAPAAFDRLSGGERQLVLLARALATGSSVLVLDEPGAALDLGNQARLLGLIGDLRRAGRHAILLTTHDPNQALAVADDVLMLMPDGSARLGPAAELVQAEPLEALYGVQMRFVGLTGADGRMRRAVVPAFIGVAA
jgi:iron complex transport system ATP-binding protein